MLKKIMRALCKSFYPAIILIIALVLQACQQSGSDVESKNKTPLQIKKVNPADSKMIFIKGGDFLMGSDEGMPPESPVHKVSVKSFWIDSTEVTNSEFAEFVKATNYKTDAEKFGWSGVFDLNSSEWTRSDGANWRNPEGDGKELLPNEPVTQISWNDANEFAKWARKRLPTEAEWEFAARGGLAQNTYAWGNDLRPDGKPVANWWQGEFPDKNTVEDGFLKRAPVKSFAPNGYGLYEMSGNVWEWTSDWYDENYYSTSPEADPNGAEIGQEKSIRGGSWMCAENFCSNYRVAGRSSATPDTGLNNLGFRCAKDD